MTINQKKKVSEHFPDPKLLMSTTAGDMIYIWSDPEQKHNVTHY